MKLSCTRENLLTGLSAVSRIAGRNLTLPILGSALVRAESTGLTLSATNLEMGVVVRVRAKIEEVGAIAVQARLLTDFINLTEADRISVATEGNTLKVSGQRSKTTIRGNPIDEFPIIPTIDRRQATTCTIENEPLKRALSETVFAAAQDAARPEISGLALNLSDTTLTLAATDSYRLSEHRLAATSASGNRSVIIPTRPINELIRSLPTEGSTTIYLTDNQALFVAGDLELTTRLIEGQYPDYQQIIPKASGTEATIDVEQFMKLVRTASLFARPGINDVTIELRPDREELACSAANTELGEHVGTMKVKLEGPPVAIVFNNRYLLEGLASLTGPTAVLGVTDSASPSVLKPVGSAGALYLIMPIRQ